LRLLLRRLRLQWRRCLLRLWLHRLEINIVPRNTNSRRVMEKLDLRVEGVAVRMLEINGVWEDHVRYAITAEEWQARALELRQRWLLPDSTTTR